MGTLKRLLPVAAALLLMIGITAVFYGSVIVAVETVCLLPCL